MCTQDGQSPGAALFGSVAEALRMADASMDYLKSPAAADPSAAACGQALAALGEIRAKHAAAYAGFLRRFDALDGPDGDGYGTSAAWLRRMRQLNRHACLHGALARGRLGMRDTGSAKSCRVTWVRATRR